MIDQKASDAVEQAVLLEEAFERICTEIELDMIDAPDINICKSQAIGLALEAVQCAAVCERVIEAVGLLVIFIKKMLQKKDTAEK